VSSVTELRLSAADLGAHRSCSGITTFSILDELRRPEGAIARALVEMSGASAGKPRA